MKKLAYLSILAVFFLPACYYTDGGIHNLDVQYDSVPEIDFFVNLDTLDSTFVVSDSLFLAYEMYIDSTELYAVDVFFGDYWIGNFNRTIDSMWIAPASTLTNGTYIISLYAAYKTNTGSIADHYSVERKIVGRDWDIEFALNPFE